MESKNGIAVYCASSTKIDNVYFEAAAELGRLIALSGRTLVNGGGRAGLMGATTDAALAAGGRVIGVIPDFMVDMGLCHPALTERIVASSMHHRKATMAALSTAVIALPGGVGTLDEIAEMMAWRKLHLFDGPVIILNTAGFYTPLLQWLQRTVDEKFTPAGDLPWQVATTPAEAMRLALGSQEQ